MHVHHRLLAGAAIAAVSVAAPTAASAAPYTDPTGTISLSTSSPIEGGTLRVSGSGWGDDTSVTIVLQAGGHALGSATVAAGSFSVTVQLPAGVSGPRTIVVTGSPSGNVQSASITILEAVRTGGSTGGQVSGTGDGTEAGGLPRTGSSNVVPLAMLGGVLVLGGAGALVLARRRTSATGRPTDTAA